MDASLRESLDLVAERGAPAQQAEAARLAAVLDVDPVNADALAAAGLLLDAYLHDPHLDKE